MREFWPDALAKVKSLGRKTQGKLGFGRNILSFSHGNDPK